jgi:hypothetical protein
MRSNSLFLLVLCSCNRLYGLTATDEVDAAYFDAPPIDCPDIGTAPRFSRSLTQAAFENCTDYTFGNGRALAKCGRVLREGPQDGALVDAAGMQSTTELYGYPRLHPDGNIAFVIVPGLPSGGRAVATFTRGDTAWSRGRDLVIDTTTLSATPSRTRLFLVGKLDIREVADDGNGNYAHVQTHTADALGVTGFFEQTHVSADGRRLVFVGTTDALALSQLFYADRPSIDVPFSRAVPMPDVDYFPSGVMTENCDRLYFSALGTVFYASMIR